jgi:hypothetical protein
MELHQVLNKEGQDIFTGDVGEVLHWLTLHMLFANDVNISTGYLVPLISVDDYIETYA